MGKNVLFIEYPKCSTCKKAKKWLDDHEIAYVDRHIVEESPTVEELRAWVTASGLPLRRFFNTSGMLYRELNVKAQLDAGMPEGEALELLASSGMLVKRPLVVIADGERVSKVADSNGGEGGTAAGGGEITSILVGFKELEWEKALL